MKVLEIQDGKLTLEYQDGSIGSVESREHALLVVRALNSIGPDSVLTNHEAENVRIAIMVAFKDVSRLEVHELLLGLCNPLRKAAFFGAIFNKVPTYAEIDLRTHEKSSPPEMNELFRIRTAYQSTFGNPNLL